MWWPPVATEQSDDCSLLDRRKLSPLDMLFRAGSCASCYRYRARKRLAVLAWYPRILGHHPNVDGRKKTPARQESRSHLSHTHRL
jgi:hypothetical protein